MEMFDFVINNPVLDALSITLLHFLWQGAALAFSLFIILKLISNKHSNTRYLISLSAMGLNILIPVITFFIIYQPEQVSSDLLTTLDSKINFLANSDLTGSSFSLLAYTPLLSIIWMIGVGYLSIHLVYEMFNAYQLPRKNVVQASDELQNVFYRLSQQLKVNKYTRLLVSMTVEVPMVIGWLRPAVLLPASMASGLTVSQLEMLLAHELAHVKRFDYLVNLLQTLVELLLFFHPCVKWISNQVKAEREYCCDDIAVNCCGNAVAYATTLADAEMLRPHNIPQLAMAATGGDLKKRVFRIVGQHSCAPKYAGQWLIGCFSLVFVGSLFMTNEVIGMTQSVDSKSDPNHLNDNLVVMIEPESTDNNVVEKPVINTKSTEKPKVKVTDKLVKTTADITENSAKPILVTQKQIVEKKVEKLIEKPKLDTVKVATKTRKKPVKPVDSKPVTQIITAKSITKPIATKTELQHKSLVVTGDIKTTKVIKTIESNKAKKLEIKAASLASADIKRDSHIENTVINLEQVIEKNIKVSPKLVRIIKPDYPKIAMDNQDEQDIRVSFVVKTNGYVSKIKFEDGVKSSFKRSIKKALKKWRFEPGKLNGKKTAMKVTKIFNFSEPKDVIYAVTGSRLSKLK